MTSIVIACATKLNDTGRVTVDDVKNLKARLPGRHVTEGHERAPHRSYCYAMDLITEQIHQPFVGVATCLNEAAPCNIAVCTENLIRVDEVKESPKLTE